MQAIVVAAVIGVLLMVLGVAFVEDLAAVVVPTDDVFEDVVV